MFKEVVPMAAAHIEARLHALGFESTDARRYWLHQAGLGMNQLVLKKLVGHEVGDDITPIVLSECAKTASAGSILQRGSLGVVCRFGADCSMRSVVLRRL